MSVRRNCCCLQCRPTKNSTLTERTSWGWANSDRHPPSISFHNKLTRPKLNRNPSALLWRRIGLVADVIWNMARARPIEVPNAWILQSLGEAFQSVGNDCSHRQNVIIVWLFKPFSWIRRLNHDSWSLLATASNQSLSHDVRFAAHCQQSKQNDRRRRKKHTNNNLAKGIHSSWNVSWFFVYQRRQWWFKLW